MDWLIGITIDIIILLILVVFYKIGAKNGFAKTLVRFLGVFIALTIASLLSGPLSKWCYTSFVKEPVEAAIANSVRSNIERASENQAFENIEETIEELPSFIKNAIPLEKYEQQIKGQLKDVTEDSITRVSQELTAKVVEPAALTILKMITFFVLFVVLTIVIGIFSNMLGIVNKIPLLGSVNKTLGGIVGLLEAVLFIIVASWLLNTYMTSSGSVFGVIDQQIVESSFIFRLFMEKNPVELILRKQN